MTKSTTAAKPGETRTLDLGAGPQGLVTMKFCFIPPCPEGFWMGSRDGRTDEQPVHRVVIPYGFWLGQTPVTQQQFQIWTDSTNYRERFKDKPHKSAFDGNPEHPAEELTWLQAAAYCQWLTEHLDATNQLPNAMQLCRLPYESEWEYACRGGTNTDYHTGDGEVALGEAGWFAGNSKNQTQRVGDRVSNEWGLHDMHGNVFEWCADRWDENGYRRRWAGITSEESFLLNERYGDQDESSTWGEDRVLRGGSWVDSAVGCRAAFRFRYWAGVSFGSRGLRACLVPSPIKPVVSQASEAGERRQARRDDEASRSE